MIRRKAYWLYLPALLLSVSTLYPILWNVMGGFKNATDAANFTGALVPTHPTLNNYVTIVRSTPFLHYVWNTLVYAGTVSINDLGIADTTALGGAGGVAGGGGGGAAGWAAGCSLPAAAASR